MAIENMAFPPTGFNMFQSHHEDQDHLPQHFHDNGDNNNSHSHNLPFFRRSMSFSGLDHGQEPMMMPGQGGGGGGGGDDDLSDDGSQLLGEKKKRLSLEQVKALEKSFELANKLEPERKLQLARGIGLQPRQVAIWFQNRRARWKTKQLERDYEVLKKQCDALRADNDSLQAENDKLHAELLALKRRYTNEPLNIPKREIDQRSNRSNNGSCENSCEVNLDMSRTSVMSSPVSDKSNSTTKHHLFPTSTMSRPPIATQQFLHSQIVQEDSFCNMFGNGVIEDQQGFWPWTTTPTDPHNQFN